VPFHVPVRRALREAVERARAEAEARGEPLTWEDLAMRAAIASGGSLRKMLQGEAPMDDFTAARIATVIGHKVVVVPEEKPAAKKRVK